ncbi:MAG TPA: hypothetical protein VMU54_23040 [Planctomycetota bacterium]|nr:hypothetical protein [Planctomycetota bacterium]
MARDLLSPIGILDDTHGAVQRVAAPWLGVLWLGLLPYRFLQAHFIRELIHLGGRAGEYGTYLEGLAWALFGTLLPAVYVRAVYVRATFLELQSGARVGSEAFRVPAAQLLTSLYLALVTEVVFALTAWMVFTVPLLVLPAGLAYAVAARTDRPGLVRPFGDIVRLLVGVKAIAGLEFAFALALGAVFVNIYMAFRLGLWALGALGGDGLSRWELLLRPLHPMFLPFLPGDPLVLVICLAGTLLVVEPFWLAALTVYVHKSNQRQSGEDLRLRFRLLTGGR